MLSDPKFREFVKARLNHVDEAFPCSPEGQRLYAEQSAIDEEIKSFKAPNEPPFDLVDAHYEVMGAIQELKEIHYYIQGWRDGLRSLLADD